MMITSISENTDKFSWKQLNCFIRPVAILCKSFDPLYFDLFLFHYSFYSTSKVDDYFSMIGQVSHDERDEFAKFFNEFIGERFKLNYSKTFYEGESDFIDKVITSLDNGVRILVLADLIGLYYNSGYLVSSHGHFFIVKGYDKDRELFFILDNMHIDAGSSTIFKDFPVKFHDLYVMSQLYFENILKIDMPVFLTIESTMKWSEHDSGKPTIKETLKEHAVTLSVNDSITCFEEELAKMLRDSQYIDQEVSFAENLNRKVVYYEVLFKFLEMSNVASETVTTLKDIYSENYDSWNHIRMLLLRINLRVREKVQSKSETRNTYWNFDDRLESVEKMICETKERESLFNKLLVESVNNIPELDGNEEDGLMMCGFKVINNKQADIFYHAEKEEVEIRYSNDKKYDFWINMNDAVQLLSTCELNDFDISCRVGVIGELSDPFQSGIVLRMASDSVFAFCLNQMERISIFPDAMKDFEMVQFELDCITPHCCLRIEKISGIINFYLKIELDDQWERIYCLETEDGVSSVGFYSKTWDKINLTTIFSEMAMKIF